MSGRGYLLDCNTLDALFNRIEIVVSRARVVPPGCFGFISAITLGEIEFGHRRNQTTNQTQRDAYTDFISKEFPWPVDVTHHTREHYGILRADLFRMFGPKKPTKGKNRVEQLCDKITGNQLGVDENDVWLASQAIEHNMVLVTNDRMKPIMEAAGTSLNHENWLDTAP